MTYSNWTFISLKAYVDSRFEALDKAISKKESADKDKFESVNEFRRQLDHQERTYMPRIECENSFKSYDYRLNETVKRQDKIENMKQGGHIVWAYVIAAISLLLSVFSFLIMLNK